MIGDILKQLRNEKEMTIAKAAETFGVANRTYSSYELEEREPNLSLLIKLADFYNVSTDYLLGRTEIKAMAGTSPAEQLDVTAAEQEIIRRYTEFPEEVRLLLLETIRKLVGLPDAPEDLRPVIVFTRCHRMKASAGMGYDLDNADEWRDVRIYDCPEAYQADFAVEVDGDSMEPDYHDGDIVFVKLSEDVPVGAVGLFIHDECRAVGVVIGKAEPAL